jgi:ligand-binding sensor domain-containing protein
MKNVRIGIFVLLFMTTNWFAFSLVRLDDWKAHTSLVYTQATEIDNLGRIWVATTGGVYSINIAGTEIEYYRNIGQMLDIDITSIKFNPATEELYIGSKNGYLDILDNEGNWSHITDILNQKFSDPRINDIAFDGDKAYIGGGFGLTVFDTKKKVFDETVRRFADFNTNIPVNRIIIENKNIWIATTSGIASANMNSILSNPDNWNGYPLKSGLFETSIKDIAIDRGICYAMSDKFITKLVDGKLEEFKQTADIFTSIISTSYTGLQYTTLFSVVDSTNNPIIMQHPDLVYGSKPFIFNNKIGYIVKYQKSGIGIYYDGDFHHFLPDSPLSNVSRDLAVDNDGNLWIATDEDPNGRGIAKFDGISWQNFTTKLYPVMGGDNYYKITVSPDGRIAAGNYGNGLLVIEPKDNDFVFKHFNRANSALTGLSGAEDYIVCGKPRFDSKNNIWVPILGNESIGPALVAFDSEYKSYGYQNTRNSNQRFFSSLAIDFYGTKWVGGSRIEGLGMLYYNEKGKFDNSLGSYSGFITQSDYPNMPDNTHSSIEVDKNGFVWIGTPRGLAVISNPGSVTQNTPTVNVRNLNRLIGEQSINYIMVDAQNNKWLATNNGVWVINSDGSDTVGVINKSNSFLPTNEIISLGYNSITGQIYFGTKLGIYEAKSLSVQPSSEYSIKCYPQPFNTTKEKELIIEGLEEFSDLRIVSLSGSLVKQFFTNSKKTIWNGKDDNGNIVPSGVYLILATSSTTKHSSVQKIAVVND